MVNFLSGVGLRSNAECPPRAETRAPGAGRGRETRRPAKRVVAARTQRPPVAFLACRLISLLVRSQHLGRFRSKTAELLVSGPILVHPACCPVVPLAGLFLVAELFVGLRERSPWHRSVRDSWMAPDHVPLLNAPFPAKPAKNSGTVNRRLGLSPDAETKPRRWRLLPRSGLLKDIRTTLTLLPSGTSWNVPVVASSDNGDCPDGVTVA